MPQQPLKCAEHLWFLHRHRQGWPTVKIQKATLPIAAPSQDEAKDALSDGRGKREPDKRIQRSFGFSIFELLHFCMF